MLNACLSENFFISEKNNLEAQLLENNEALRLSHIQTTAKILQRTVIKIATKIAQRTTTKTAQKTVAKMK